MDKLLQCSYVFFLTFSWIHLINQSTYAATLTPTEVKSNIRIFHPSFPLKIKDPIPSDEITKLNEIRNRLQISPSPATTVIDETISKRLPWSTLPQIGVSSNLEKDVYSKKEIDDIYENQKYNGYLIWANKLKNPKSGCFLLNHWNQKVIHLVDYNPIEGSRGYEIILGTSQVPSNPTATIATTTKTTTDDNDNGIDYIIWPPFTLETEIFHHKWQPVEVSENIASGEIFQFLPEQMRTAPWELIFLLLLSPIHSTGSSSSYINDIDDKIYQTLFDTGLSPKQGLFAYMRLLDQVTQRAQLWQDIPAERRVFETELQFFTEYSQVEEGEEGEKEVVKEENGEVVDEWAELQKRELIVVRFKETPPSSSAITTTMTLEEDQDQDQEQGDKELPAPSSPSQ